MNISQHSIVMLGYDPFHYYSDSGTIVNSSSSTGTTLLAPTCGANTIITFCRPFYEDNGIRYGGIFRLFKDIVLSDTPAQPVLLSKYTYTNVSQLSKPVTFINNEASCYAFTVSSLSFNYPMVTYVMYRDNSSVPSMLSLGNTFSLDVIYDLNELI